MSKTAPVADAEPIRFTRAPAVPSGSLAWLFLRWASRTRNFRVGAAGFLVCVLVVLLAPVLAPFPPHDIDADASLAPPSLRHLMGTDQFGRDVFSRLLYGGRLTISTGVLAVFIGAVPGTAIGLVSGLGNYAVDLFIMRGIDILMAFPSMLLALMIVTIRGPGLGTSMVAVAVSLIPIYVRVVRAAALSIREQPYVEAARAVGCSFARIAVRHVLPSVLPSVIVLSTVALAWAIVIASTLSFLGLGPQPPTPEWGVDLANGRNYLRIGWWISSFPGFAIMVVVLSTNLLGDSLRDWLDPKLRRTSEAVP